MLFGPWGPLFEAAGRLYHELAGSLVLVRVEHSVWLVNTRERLRRRRRWRS